MVHSDYRLDNLLFHNGQVTMIDWQTTMWAPAAMDVSCFLTTSLSIESRRQNEGALVDRYLQRLDDAFEVQAALTTMVERVYTAAVDRNVGRLL